VTDGAGHRLESLRRAIVTSTAALLPIYTIVEINRPSLRPQSELLVFALLGLPICFLRERPGATTVRRVFDLGLTLLFSLVCVYLISQGEPLFEKLWLGGSSLGDRAAAERPIDFIAGALGLLLLFEATRRAVGPTLPLLAIAAIAYARVGPALPEWLLPHRGYDWPRIISQTFLQSQGVFGVAMNVMFRYVFLFVVFGAILEATGATGFLIEWSRRLFRSSPGGPAKMAVLSSGLMGSLSGSAVANTATTGTFTIPLMRSSGFAPHIAAGVEAAASSGGALVPPVMGAGAYMMLELVDPPVTYLQIIRAAMIPAMLYYLSLFLMVHFHSRRLLAEGSMPTAAKQDEDRPLVRYAGFLLVAGLATLLVFLLRGFSVFRAVTVALAATLVLSALNDKTRLSARRLLQAIIGASRSGVSLVAAAACVGVVIGVVTLTGVGTELPARIVPLAQGNLLAALALIMVSSIVLGVGLPSAVTYLLMATLIGPVLGQLGVVPLAAHLFVFYFGMMSMVTPPVALAAYTASTIAGTSFVRTSMAAFRFALVGFTLPFMFVLRPELLLMSADGSPAPLHRAAGAVLLAVLGIVPLAAAIGGSLIRPLGVAARLALVAAALLCLLPAPEDTLRISGLNAAGIAILALVTVIQVRRARASNALHSNA